MITATDDARATGRSGVNVYNGAAVFDNVLRDSPGFVTNLSGPWQPVRSAWTTTATGAAGRGPGDSFRLSATAAPRSRTPASPDPAGHDGIMRLTTPWWALLSSAVAPTALIGGWTLAARRQPDGYDGTVSSISSLAALDATDRWLMTVALVVVGICHLVTALGMSRAATAGRVGLGLGGAATILVAVFPLPATGSAPAHAVAAGVAFVALAVWPAFAWRRDRHGPAVLRPAVSLVVAVVLLGLVAWFGATLGAGGLGSGGRVGLAERVAAGAQACWPLAVTLSCLPVRRARPARSGR